VLKKIQNYCTLGDFGRAIWHGDFARPLRTIAIRSPSGSICDQKLRRKPLKQFSKGVLVFAALFLALTVMAKSKRYEVAFPSTVQAGGMEVKEGTYQVEVEGGTATFYQGKKEIGKVTVRSEELGKKVEVTRVGVSGDKLTSIELGGTKTKLNVE
jgi:hypothetical protein